MSDNIMNWLGKSVTETQKAELWPGRGLAAVLDKPFTAVLGDPIPLLAHWTYFTPMVPQSRIGFDGHPQRGDFIPPILQPRRMWASSDIYFKTPIRFGDDVTKRAEITKIEEKEGASGKLIFLEIVNDYSVDSRLCLSETQTVVYRDPPAKDETPRSKPAPETASWSESVSTPTTRLFRYSAVTFNAHQIHYDHPYVTEEEGYPGVIVQGQFIATMLAEAFQNANPGTTPRRFSFRAIKPVFANETFWAEGKLGEEHTELWARDSANQLRMSAKIIL